MNDMNMKSDSRFSRLEDAYSSMSANGWEPLKPEERGEFERMVAEFTNL